MLTCDKFKWNPFNLASRRRLLWAWVSWLIGENLDFIFILKQQFKASLEQYFNFLSFSILRNAECHEGKSNWTQTPHVQEIKFKKHVVT